ncbi:MAG: hypothetical protein ABFS45_01550 [Pseudomonadota bacterium]
MTKLRWTLFATLLIFAFSADVQADDFYGVEYLDTLTGICEFDGGTPPEGALLPRNTKVSLGGDPCIAFQVWVGPLDGSTADLIPRAVGVFSWQQCRFSNVMTQEKIDTYALAYANESDEVMLYGVCGEIDGDSDPAPDQDGTFVPTGYMARILMVDSD